GTALHYLVVKDAEAGPSLSVSRRARVGPYEIVEYRPAIDYRDWRYAVLPRADGASVPENGWLPRSLPAADVGALEPGQGLAWKGGVRVPAPGTARVAVMLSGQGALDVIHA